MSKPILVCAALLTVALPVRSGADLAAPPPPQAPAAGDLPATATDESSEIARLRALPPSHIPLKAATLASVVRLLAQTAHMSYLAPGESEFGERITSDVMMNPYDLLQVLGDSYGFGMEYRHGVWRFYRINLNELVSKSYTIRFNNLRQVSIASSTINGQLAAAAGNGVSGMGGGSSPPRQGGASQGTFNVKPDKIIEDIKKILGFPTVGVATPSLDGSPGVPGVGADRKPQDAPKVEPIWNAETSQLFVVATRQQHSLIAAYLKTIDQPQKLVRIAVKFVETSRNPTQALGVDWSQTFLGFGGPIGMSGASVNTTATGQSNAGQATITTSNSSGSSSSGTTATGTAAAAATPNALSAAINLNHPGNIPLPTVLMTAPAFQWTAQAIAQDKFSSIVQDPVIYTTNNREVSFKDTTQEPVQQGSTTIGSATAATTSQIAYIDVGTEVTILPCVLPGKGPNQELIQLNLSINVSSIIGTQLIGGNPYPVTSSRVYSYSVSVPVGQTLAIAGLEERTRQTQNNQVPIFGDIPVLGYAFKNKNDQVVHTTLLAFITPEIVSTDGSDTAAMPNFFPPFRHRVFQGVKDETLSQVDLSLRGLPEDIADLVAMAGPANRSAVLNRLDLIEVELSLIDVRLGELRLSGRVTARESSRLAADREKLAAARARVRGTADD